MRDKNNFITSPRGSEVKQTKQKDLVTIILFSENHGHRMKSYGPISLIKIGNKTLIEKQIDAINNVFSNFEIILCSGFETSKIVTFIKSKLSHINIRIVENQIHYNSNCCESARLCINNTTNNKVLFCNGGILINSQSLNAVDLNTNCVLMQDHSYDPNFEIGIIQNNNRLENFSLGVKNKYWSEIFFINGEKDIANFSSILYNPDFKNKFMFEAINEFNKKSYIRVIKNPRESMKLDNIKTLKRISL